MIEKIRIRGYRKFRDATITPHAGLNLLVGDNESGKSTVLEAIGLALTGRVNGRPAQEELNPYWFNRELVDDFFAKRARGDQVAVPTISIELFLEDKDELQRLLGAVNSESPPRACPGVQLLVEPNPEYAAEIDEHVKNETSILPVEYYRVEWRSFADSLLTARPKELTTAIIDSRTIRSTSGVDYHLRQILSAHLQPEEKAAVALAFRLVKEHMTDDHLKVVNERMALLEGALDGAPLSLAMDQTSRTSWDSSVVPHVADVPFGMAGQGQQAAVKIALAMERSTESARVVMIEEPENHLSHTSLNKLIHRIERLAGETQQLFIATHSSYVLNRLGLDSLVLVSDGKIATIGEVSAESVNYFRKLPGYDTLRMVLADRFVLVEGPSDEIVFERFYHDRYGKRPIEDGVDVVSMRGLSSKRCLEIAKVLGKRCAVIRDNDELDPASLRSELGELLLEGSRQLFVGAVDDGTTLEPQIIKCNDEATLRKVLGITDKAVLGTWMKNNKTEAAIRIADATMALVAPRYLADAIEFVYDAK